MIEEQKPKILFIHNTYLYKGGEGTVVNNEIDVLKKNGFTVFYKEFSNARFDKKDFKILFAPINTIFNFFSFFYVLYFILIKNIKIVHAHNIFYTASPSVFWAAKLAGAKTVMTIHNYRFFCLSANFFRNGKNCFECNEANSFKMGIKYRCFKNSWLASLTLTLSIRINDSIGSWKNKIDYYIVLNEFTKQLFINQGIKPEKIILKANFLLENDTKNAISTKKDYYLYIGRITEEKGIHHLIDAFSNSNKKLIIAGTGDLVEFVKNLNTANISFIGPQSKYDVQLLLLKCKALIFPSIWIESMPMSIIEAQSLGTIPIVASSVNTNNMIEHNKDGFLYDPTSPNALIEAINQFESLTSNQLDVISNNARNKSLKLYGEIAHIKKIKEIYGI